MGAGTYSQVIYGIRSMKAADLDEDVVIPLADEIFHSRPSIAYEAATDHLGISLVNTLGFGDPLSIGTCGLDELASRVRACCEKHLPGAREQWKKLQEEAAKKGLTIPDGDLLWVEDYD